MPGAKRRLTRKEKITQSAAIVDSAKKATDLLSFLPEWTTYKKHDLDLKVEYKSAPDLSSEDTKTIFDLLKINMESFYNKSDWGWEDNFKLEELTHKDARFLIVRDSTDKIVGFSHFRFDMESNYPILYCYELQIENAIQRKGIGKHLMSILTLIAYKFKLVKILLTVFKDNTAGLNFYRNSLHFGRDESCPYDEEGKCYLILRKSVDKTEISNLKC
ncbi:n-alpha-acetyltransferase 40 [Trichonephila inaurata madagascariensis]|uniref:N-alpha-acetyltransferase 40 n=1 Tax=Trichonephila inaurata madagascariensis TaxID=2747483 RepID=A0A8X6XRR5_9ARAC|nr:n-alpha-acetyltransferase 40 [Trichonephila inaurata madagascariensis]